jgi:dTDP-4-dehydrorhamnose 3,5-epimerase-like enzyme
MSYLFVRAIHLKISPHQEGKFFSNIHGFIYSHWVHTSAGEPCKALNNQSIQQEKQEL